jgi:phosphatidyl-myo-inositol alpha-mannosyltransferase
LRYVLLLLGGDCRDGNDGADEPVSAWPKLHMKIAQLCPYDIRRPGGVQRHILDLSVALRSLGHDVTIIAPGVAKSDRTASRDSGADAIIYIGAGKLFALNQTQFELTLARGVELARLHALLQTGAFEVLHFHTLLAPFLPMQAFRRSHAANVGTFHEVPPDTATGSLQRLAYRAFGRRVMRKLDGIILASEVQKDLHASGPAAPLAILPPCTNLQRFRTNPEPIAQYRDGTTNILFLGRLESRKGAMLLLQAYRRLRQRGSPLRLLIAGEGPERARLERFARKHGMDDVIFLGLIGDADLPRLYATCDVFCAPALYAEGFGIVLAEAMASGKPIAAVANAGYRTVLRGEAANLLAPPGDAEALCSKLDMLVDDQALRHRLGEWGRREAQRFDSGVLAPKFVSMYERAMQWKARRTTARSE